MIRKSFPSAIKQADDRTFTVTVSTASVDRDGDSIDPKGWQLESYRHNPIVLWQHDNHLPPIARCTDIRVQGNRLIAKMEFPPVGLSSLADEIHGLMVAGFLHSTSVGFRLLRSTPNGTGRDIHQAELMEFSVVNIPSQIEARVMRCAGEPCNEVALKSWLGHKQNKEDQTMDTELWLDVSDDFFTKVAQDDFDALLARLRQNRQPPTLDELAQFVDAGLRYAGGMSLDDLFRHMNAHTPAMRSWDGQTPETLDVDEKDLALAIGRVIAEEAGKQTRAALNAALGRLD
jgi:HK97 family phage prohead protease